MSNTLVRNEIVHSMNSIDECVDDSILAVLCSVIQEYEKISVMMDNAEDDYFIYQEGQVWDTAIGKGKDESGVMKIIAFIPRLFQGIINAITAVFSKEKDATFKKDLEEAQVVIKSATEEELEEASDEIKKKSNGEMSFDPEKKQFHFKNGLKHIRNYIQIGFGLSAALKKIVPKLEGKDIDYDIFIRDIKAGLQGKGEDNDTFYASMDMLKSLCNDAGAAALGVRGLSSEISMKLEKKMRKDFANGKDISQKAKAKELLDTVSEASKSVVGMTMATRMIRNAVTILGRIKLGKRSPDATTKERTKASSNIKAAEKRVKSFNKELEKCKERMEQHKNDAATKQKYVDEYNNKLLEVQKAEAEVKKAKLEQDLIEQKKRETDPDVPSDALNKISEAIEKVQEEINNLEEKIKA